MDKELVIQYESYLIGREPNIPKSCFSGDKASNMKKALIIYKYAFETYLGWDPYALRDYLTYDIIKKLRLDTILHYIQFPAELDSKKDMFYIIWKIYPFTVNFSRNELIIRTYKKVLDKELQRFPKDFFAGSTGLIRSGVCLRYMIEQYVPADGLESLYRFFSEPKAEEMLQKYKLYASYKVLFRTPLDYLNYTLPPQQRNALFYSYYSFVYERRKTRR